MAARLTLMVTGEVIAQGCSASDWDEVTEGLEAWLSRAPSTVLTGAVRDWFYGRAEVGSTFEGYRLAVVGDDEDGR